MQVKCYHFLFHYLIFCIQYYWVNTKPLIGVNVHQAGTIEFPFIVSLNQIKEGNSSRRKNHICSGMLITRQDVLSAEHCIVYDDLATCQILVGSNDLRQCNRSDISWWISFDQWTLINKKKTTFEENDIAIIRLLAGVPNQIVPVQISFKAIKDLYGLKVTAASWGRLNQTYMSHYIHKAELNVLSNSECIQRITALGEQNPRVEKKQMLCTVAEPYTLLHNGDSGGPLLFENDLIGINKGTFPITLEDCNPHLINLHVGVHYYKKFITSIMNDNS